MALDFTKPVTTRDGRKVRILCEDKAGTDSPVVGLIMTDKGYEALNQWKIDGSCGIGRRETDLINPVKKVYINLFKNDVGRMYYDTREEAEKAGNSSNKANPSVGYAKTIEVEV